MTDKRLRRKSHYSFARPHVFPSRAFHPPAGIIWRAGPRTGPRRGLEEALALMDDLAGPVRRYLQRGAGKLAFPRRAQESRASG
jgi:hypothetical protein